MRLSLVIPSYNQAAFLETCLRSALEQAHPDLEVLVMDGGSTDGSREIIERHAGQLAYWQSQPDGGQAAAINAGMALATGDILTWLNSDDFLLPGALSLVREVFTRWPQVRWLTGRPANADAEGRLAEIGPATGRFRALIRRGWYHGRGLGFIRQEGTFWRRTLWEQAGGQVSEHFQQAMDFDLWRRFAAHADLVTVDSILAAFRFQPNQKTADSAYYYHEAGVRVPAWLRPVILPCRALFTLASWPFAPRIVYRRAAPGRPAGWELKGMMNDER